MFIDEHGLAEWYGSQMGFGKLESGFNFFLIFMYYVFMSFHHVNYEIIHQHESSSFSSSIDIKMHSLRLFARFDVLEK